MENKPITLTDEQLPIFSILNGGRRKWITKQEALVLTGLKRSAFDKLVHAGIIKCNDKGKGKDIHYLYDSCEKYLDNPTKSKNQIQP